MIDQQNYSGSGMLPSSLEPLERGFSNLQNSQLTQKNHRQKNGRLTWSHIMDEIAYVLTIKMAVGIE